MKRDEVEDRIRELLARADHRGAATVAIRAYGPELLRYLHSLLGDPDRAREAFSQTAESLWRGLPEFRGEAPLRAWTYRIAWRSARDLHRQAWNRRGERLSTGEASRLAAAIGTSSAERHERRRALLAELREELPLEDRALAALRLDDGLSWEECAVILAADGVPLKPNTLTKRFERIKDRLGKLARERGLLE